MREQMKVSDNKLSHGRILTVTCNIQWNEWKLPVRRVFFFSIGQKRSTVAHLLKRLTDAGKGTCRLSCPLQE